MHNFMPSLTIIFSSDNGSAADLLKSHNRNCPPYFVHIIVFANGFIMEKCFIEKPIIFTFFSVDTYFRYDVPNCLLIFCVVTKHIIVSNC